MSNSAFSARFRVVGNNSPKQNAPEKNLIIDFSCDEAVKAANYILQMVDNAKIEDTKIRVYSSKSEYDEVSGFRSGAVCGVTQAESSLCHQSKPLRGL